MLAGTSISGLLKFVLLNPSEPFAWHFPPWKRACPALVEGGTKGDSRSLSTRNR